MRKAIIVLILAMLLFGSMIVLVPNAVACHNKTVSCSPTEKDITDMNTYTVEYELDLHLTPGCGNQYWVGFTADAAPTGWARKVYEKGDATKTDLLHSTAPPSSDFTGWGGWISAGSGNIHFYAILEVKVTDTGIVENGDTAVITVHCWSYDVVPNDLEDDPVTTTTTLNIPHGIRMYHTVAYEATKWVYPGQWAEFDLSIQNIGNASGLIDLSKDTTSSPCLQDNWDWEFSANPITLPEFSPAKFKLKVRPPLDAEFGDFAMFIAKGVSRADPKNFTHTVTAKTIVTIPLPDISIKSADMKCMAEELYDGDKVNVSIVVWNLGDIDVKDFELTWKLTDPGNEQPIGSKIITDTLKPNGYLTVMCEWTAFEGDHSICIHADENEDILEKDEEGNNEAGLVVTVNPAKPKKIILSSEINPTSCMPKTQFKVSGEAKFNKEYNSLPVTNANVQVKIVDTNKITNGKTNNKGEFDITCTAPEDEGTYTIQVTVSKEGLTASKTDYLTVASFLVSVGVLERTVITGNDFKINGRVTENDYGVAIAKILLELMDSSNTVVASGTTETDPDGFYSYDLTSPDVKKYTTYKLKVTATKQEISGSTETELYVDIDTDEDNKADSVDEDDDNDGYPDTLEVNMDTDSLDPTDYPGPVAVLGDDKTIDEGKELDFSGDGSYSLAASQLTYIWDFGDDSDQETGESVKHTYNADGQYTVTLTVKDTYGGSDSTDITVTVNDLTPTVSIQGPSAGEIKTELTFTATANSPVDTITKYSWDFGDGSTGTGDTVRHIWATDDDYTVKVTITDSDGSTAEATLSVQITKPEEIEGTTGEGKSTEADSTLLYIGIIIVIIVVVLLALLMLMRKKKPATQAGDGRVASNFDAQSSRRPTTPFADANIKPAMGAANQPKMAVPGSVPQRPAVGTSQQVSQLPPAPQSSTQTPPTSLQQTPQTSPQEQKDWNWDFNE
jgi:PKD repeat protein